MAKRTNLRLMAVAVMVVLIGTGSAWADVYDHFDDGVLDLAWGITFDNATGWTYSESGTDITVTDVAIDDPGYSTAARTYLNQNFYASSDFEVEFSLSWDCDGKDSFIGALRIELYGGDTVIARAGYYDPWLYHRGAKLAVIGEQSYHTGTNTLPFADSAIVKIQRIAGVITVLWDDTVLFSDNNNQVVDNLKIDFTQDRYSGATFGSFSVDYVSASSVELVSLEITGPDEVAENFQAQYNAIAHYDNNYTADVTGLAVWSVEPNDIASITAGLLTTEVIDLPQDLTVTARYTDVNTVEAQKMVSVFAICPSGSALQFDGVDDYVDLGNLGLTEPITVSIWLKPNDTLNDRRLFQRLTSAGTGAGDLHIVNNDIYVWRQHNSHEKIVDLSSSWSGAWHHLAVVYNADKTVIGYFDGFEHLQATSIGLDWDAGPMGLGNKYYQCGNTFNGIVDEVSIYNQALSAEEIRTLMHTRPDVNEPNLVAYWDFDEGEGQDVNDLSGNGNVGRLGSDPNADENDPNWVDSDAPVGICSSPELMERNFFKALGIKENILEQLQEAMSVERAIEYLMEESYADCELGDIKKSDMAKARQDLDSAMREEGRAETSVNKSIEKLDDALNTLAQ